jgi:bifunctional NMN adenylyltransferase/nudix hydrolase
VIANHKKVILFLGVSPVIGTTKDPLDFTTRKLMIQEHYPDINIAPLPDHRSDSNWSRMIDSRIREIFPIGSVILYGGRDSFLPHYHGHFPTSELEQTVYVSGTEIRKQVSEEIKSSHLWRAGAIYQAYNQYPVSYQTVDIAVIAHTDEILMIQKEGDGEKYRFVGGFSDPQSPTLEHDAYRELKEECGINLNTGVAHYVSSRLIDDWRYKNNKNCKIKTAFFVAKHLWGKASPMSEITECKWIHVSMLSKNVVDEHLSLVSDLEHWLRHNKNKL